MVKIKVEYFGPAKRFTSNKEFDLLEISTTRLPDAFEKLAELYGIEFVKYIITSCGVVQNIDYLNIELRELASTIDNKNYKSVINTVFESIVVEDRDVIVIVPPVSSG